MAKIVIKVKGVIREERELTRVATAIGRTSENEIILDNPAVSRSHAAIVRKGDKYLLEDLDSRNGTFVNGQRIQRHELQDGDSILVGKHTLLYVDHQNSSSENSFHPGHSGTFKKERPGAQLEDIPSNAEAPSRAGHVEEDSCGTTILTSIIKQPEGYLTVLSGDLSRTKYHLSNTVTILGKDDNAEIRLTGLFTPRLVGVIHRRADGFYIAPSGRNMKLNEVLISGKQKLMDGNIISYKEFSFRFNHKES
ncbi:MAG: FHA domain-containing protein [Magnetococcus sp. DMHC-6]